MDVTRDEFTALTARVAALETRIGVTPPAATGPAATGPVTPAQPQQYTLTAPTVKTDGASYTISGQVTANSASTFAYLQLAVRGPEAKDLAMTPNKALVSGQTWNLIGTATGSGDYTTWVALSLDGKVWVDGPKTAFTVTNTAPVTPVTPASPVTGKGQVPLAGKSGLPFNSLVFRTSVSAAEQFGQRRGAAMDGLMYFTPRSNWNDLRWMVAGMKDYLASGHIVVVRMPHAPESEGTSMNTKGANDAYKSQQRDLGKYLADNGCNVPNLYISVDWELNGNWYAWSIKNGGVEASKASIRNYVTNMRSSLTKTKFGMCDNKGPSQSGACSYDAFPGAEYIDNVGNDCYDMWLPAYTESDWEREMAKTPSPRRTAEFAKAHGITWSWDEGGPTHGDKNQGGDNPFYFQMRRKEIQRNIDNFAYDVTYDDPGAPASLMHDFARNPKCWGAYTTVGMWKPA